MAHSWKRVALYVAIPALFLTTLILPPAIAAAASNPIVVENQQPGSNGWQIGAISNDSTGQIKGYASATSVLQGQSVSLSVTVNPAQSYTIDFYRIGWYGGAGGRLRLHAGPLSGVTQPACGQDATTGLTDCNWPASYTLTVPTDWTSGVYLALLTNAAGYQSYVMFVVRDGRPAPLLYQESATTEQAYNNYPDNGSTGKSLYTYNSYGANTVSNEKRAVKVSFDRPYNLDGAGHFRTWEVPFIRWLERSGYDVTYSTDLDTHENGAELRNHKAFLSVGHDEYWSKEMFDAAESARDAGVNLAFFGADAMGWQVRFEPSAGGTADRVMVCYRDALSRDPIQGPTTTTEWQLPPVNRPEQTVMGVQFASMVNWDATVGFVVKNSSNWVYAGTGFHDGDVVPGILGYEMDRQWTTLAGPPTTSQVLLSDSPFTDSNGKADRSNASIYQVASGAWVFAAGTMSWAWGLDNYTKSYADTRIQQTTSNILNAFVNSGTPPPPAPLQITAVQAGNIAATSATVTWTTNNLANSRVDYGTTTAYGGTASDAANLTGHSLALSGLVANTTYHYQVTSLDTLGQTASSPDATFVTSATAPNLVPNPGFESGAASWGLTSTATIDATAANAHSGTQSLKLAATAGWQSSWASFPVTPGTQYTFGGWQRSATAGGYISIFSYDANWAQTDSGTHLVFSGGGSWTTLSGTYVPPANTVRAQIGVSSSGAGTFWFDDIFTRTATPPPALQISAVSSGTPGTTSARVSWTTNNAANSRVDYGTTIAYGTVASDATLVTGHAVALSGLLASTTYHYKVTSVDGSSQSAASGDLTFTTSAPPALLISGVGSGTPKATSAVISWTTSNAANSRVDFGTTTGYGTVATDAAPVANHTISLVGLAPSTTYHYKVTSVDGFSQSAASTDLTFTTAAPPALQITGVGSGTPAATSAVITWTTTNSANSRVDYGTTTSYGTFASDATAVTSHTIALSGLTPSTSYHYRVTSVDGFSQTAVTLDATFTTSAAVTNILPNPGFESGTTSWQLASTASIDTVAANAHSGTRSLKLVATAGWQGTWNSAAVTAGVSYTFGTWQRSTTSGGNITIISYDSSWRQLDAGKRLNFTAGGAWTQVTSTYVPVAGAAYVLIGLASSVAGTFWFDDVSLTAP